MPHTQPPDPARLEGVIFDLDGVLFDSQDANVAYYDAILREMGLPPAAEAHREVIHREAMLGSLRALVGDGPPLERALEVARVMDFQPFIRLTRLHPGAHEALAVLAPHLRLAVATNRGKSARPALAHFGLLGSFEVVVTPRDAGCAKPDARFMDQVLAMLGLARDQVVYVGDSSVDMDLCAASGVPLVAYRAPELRAWAHVDELAQVPALLGLG